jgi:hypothetical protein
MDENWVDLWGLNWVVLRERQMVVVKALMKVDLRGHCWAGSWALRLVAWMECLKAESMVVSKDGRSVARLVLHWAAMTEHLKVGVMVASMVCHLVEQLDQCWVVLRVSWRAALRAALTVCCSVDYSVSMLRAYLTAAMKVDWREGCSAESLDSRWAAKSGPSKAAQTAALKVGRRADCLDSH